MKKWPLAMKVSLLYITEEACQCDLTELLTDLIAYSSGNAGKMLSGNVTNKAVAGKLQYLLKSSTIIILKL